jgi:hypothetical protein
MLQTLSLVSYLINRMAGKVNRNNRERLNSRSIFPPCRLPDFSGRPVYKKSHPPSGGQPLSIVCLIRNSYFLVESTAGAAELSAFAVESGVATGSVTAGVSVFAESPVFSPSPVVLALVQAAKVPATARIKRIFFMFFVLKFKIDLGLIRRGRKSNPHLKNFFQPVPGYYF